MTIQIEEGKWYARADGSVHGPTERDNPSSAYPIWASGACYTDDGLFYADQPDHPFNLVREVPEPGTEPAPAAAEPEWAAKVEAEAAEEKPFALEVGKTYRDRSGERIGPLRESIVDKWPFATDWPDNRVYQGGGKSYRGRASDLIAEWVDEPAQDPLLRAMLDDGIVTEPVADIKTHIADEAKRIVSGARRSAYGTPEQNFDRIAAMWTGYAKAKGWPIEFTANDVSPLMILMKLARIVESPEHLDSWVDAVGYSLTGAEVNKVRPPSA